MKNSLQPVILAGGSGTRLWPLSREGYPKQFLILDGNTSLLQQTAQRVAALASTGAAVQPPLVVGGEEHRFLIVDQLREIRCEPAHVVLEPLGRNTAPAITLAALHASAAGEDPVLVVTPADQTVRDPAAFTAALAQAAESAASGDIVVLGIAPERPETGFGYIRCSGATSSANAGTAAAVEQFVEKPDLATAVRYLEEGGYYWNAGIFVLRASTWLKALSTFRPDILDATRTAALGASYGGYLASWVAGHTDRFKAIVCHAGVTDFDTQYAADSAVYWLDQSAGGTPWTWGAKAILSSIGRRGFKEA